MKNVIYHICPHCHKVVTSAYEKEEDYARTMLRANKILEDHMTNTHNDRYSETKRNRSRYGED